MHARGGSRYGAVNFIKRKNDPWEIGKPTLSDDEIEAFVDSAGEWEK